MKSIIMGLLYALVLTSALFAEIPETSWERLENAINTGNIDTVNTVLAEENFSLNDFTTQHHPLLMAVKAGNYERVAFLMETEIPLLVTTNQNSNERPSILAYSLMNGYTDMCRFLLEDCNHPVDISSSEGMTSDIYFACRNRNINIGLIRFLIMKGSAVNQSRSYENNYRGMTHEAIIHKALETDRADILEILLKNGADANALYIYYGESWDGISLVQQTPLDLVSNLDHESIDLLKRYGGRTFDELSENWSYQSMERPNGLPAWCIKDGLEFRTQQDNDGEVMGHLEAHEKIYIIRSGVKSQIQGVTGTWYKVIRHDNRMGWVFGTGLSLSPEYTLDTKWEDLQQAIDIRDRDAVDALLAQDLFEFWEFDYYKHPALPALQSDNRELLQFLCRTDLPLLIFEDGPGALSLSLLTYAIEIHNEELARYLLLECNHPVDISDGMGSTSDIIWAIRADFSDDFIAKLIEAGANINEDRGGSFYGGGSFSGTEYDPIHVAIERNRLEVVRMMIDNGADIDAIKYRFGTGPGTGLSVQSETALDLAEESGLGQIATLLKNNNARNFDEISDTLAEGGKLPYAFVLTCNNGRIPIRETPSLTASPIGLLSTGEKVMLIESFRIDTSSSSNWQKIITNDNVIGWVPAEDLDF